MEEVDPVDAEAEALALTEAGAGSQHDEGPIAVRTGVGHLLDLYGSRSPRMESRKSSASRLRRNCFVFCGPPGYSRHRAR